MPRYYFHFVSTTDRFPDPEGVALDDLGAAHLHARRLMWRIVSFARGENFRRWQVRVADETQSVVLIVLFPAEVVKSEFGRREPANPNLGANANVLLRAPSGEGHRP